MIGRILCLWMLMATQALAAPILVKTGEHGSFTRLVVDYGRTVKWQVGRTEDGYALRVDGSPPEFDFSQSFRIIGTSRLVALTTDESNGDLLIGVACRCYAIPFEFRDGIVVVDLRDGPPPKGSSFETALVTSQSDVPRSRPSESPVPLATAKAPYDWTAIAVAQATGKPEPPPQISAEVAQRQQDGLDSLRENLIGQLGRGASQGVIDLALPETAEPEAHPATDAVTEPLASHLSEPSAGQADFVSVRAGLGALPAISITSGSPEHEEIGAKGESCLLAEDLNFATWRGEGAVAEQMPRATQNLIGEFDQIDPAALTDAIHFYLGIGFGAEARQVMQAFPSDLPQVPLWRALADLVDGLPDTSGVFRGQMGCDTPAALWAILANPQVEEGDLVNKGATYLAFSDLPIELRRSLGPTLAARFLAMGDEDTALKIRDAIQRAPGVSGPDVTLLEAAIDMHSGQHAEAEHKLQTVVSEPGPSAADATVALVEARVAQNQTVAPELVTALAAMVQERASMPQAEAIRRALILAQAASGDFSSAFTAAEHQAEVMPTLWRLLARMGDDNALLSHAVLDSGAVAARSDAETRIRIASRLTDLGMADSARQWISDDTAVDPLLLAKIDLQRRDARGVLRLLAENDSVEALPLRAEAMQQLGDEAGAAALFAQIGDPEAAMQARARAQDWSDLSQNGNAGWMGVAKSTEPTRSSDVEVSLNKTPLAFGKTLLDRTAATRRAVEELLREVAQP